MAKPCPGVRHEGYLTDDAGRCVRGMVVEHCRDCGQQATLRRYETMADKVRLLSESRLDEIWQGDSMTTRERDNLVALARWVREAHPLLCAIRADDCWAMDNPELCAKWNTLIDTIDATETHDD